MLRRDGMTGTMSRKMQPRDGRKRQIGLCLDAHWREQK